MENPEPDTDDLLLPATSTPVGARKAAPNDKARPAEGDADAHVESQTETAESGSNTDRDSEPEGEQADSELRPEGGPQDEQADSEPPPESEPQGEQAEGDALPGPEPETPEAPPDPNRKLLRLGWAAVAVLVVLVVLLVVGMMRISNAVDNVACIQRAQANFAATASPGASAYDLGLARLANKIALQKCG